MAFSKGWGRDVVTIISPTVLSKTSYFFGATEMATFDSKAVVKDFNLSATYQSVNVPILILSTIHKIDTLNFYIETKADTTDADTWKLYFIPVWLTPNAPLTSLTPLIYRSMVFTDADEPETYDAYKVLERTQPASLLNAGTLISVSLKGAHTIDDGVGSHTAFEGPQKVALTAPYMYIDLETGSNSQITINFIKIWGSRRAV